MVLYEFEDKGYQDALSFRQLLFIAKPGEVKTFSDMHLVGNQQDYLNRTVLNCGIPTHNYLLSFSLRTHNRLGHPRHWMLRRFATFFQINF